MITDEQFPLPTAGCDSGAYGQQIYIIMVQFTEAQFTDDSSAVICDTIKLPKVRPNPTGDLARSSFGGTDHMMDNVIQWLECLRPEMPFWAEAWRWSRDYLFLQPCIRYASVQWLQTGRNRE
jgi:hypothetical protein